MAPPQRRHDGNGHEGGDDVQTAIRFVVRSLDDLKESVVRLESTVREDFVSTADMEVVRLQVMHLRDDVQRQVGQIERDMAAAITQAKADMQVKIDQHQAATAERLKSAVNRRDTDVRIGRWLVRVGIPLSTVAALKLLWDIFGAAIKRGLTGGP